MADPRAWTCPVCGSVGLVDGCDGYFYCLSCNSQAEDIVETGVADEDFVDKGGPAGGPLYNRSHRRSTRAPAAEPLMVEPISQVRPYPNLDGDVGYGSNQARIKTEETEFDGVGPSSPQDFGSSEKIVLSDNDYYETIRYRYVSGLQRMIQLQCEALVREFKVSPLICGLAGTVWLRFVAATRVFDDALVDKTIEESESQSEQKGEPPDFKPRAKYASEPHNRYGQRAVMIWFRWLRKKIPLSYTLGVSFLVCHLAREAVLTTDIVKWSLEGKLPYFAAFVEIENNEKSSTAWPIIARACPISASVMFRPRESVNAQKLESISASIADSVGLALPPVNFYAIASRYLRELSLPSDKILPHACRIHEWSMPPDLWLSTNELRLPTRVCVMSMLIVAIRILYNIHGFGVWENSVSRHRTSVSNATEESELKQDPDMKEDAGKDPGSPQIDGTNHDTNISHAQKTELDAAELLCDLEARYNGINENHEYSKDLPTYLQFCKDVVFAGLEPESREETELIDNLWKFYQKERDSKTAVQEEAHGSGAINQKRARVDVECLTWPPRENKKSGDKECIGDLSPYDSSWSVGDRHGETSDQFDSSQNDESSEQKDQASVDTLKDETPETLRDETPETLKDETPETLKDETPETLKDETPETLKDETAETLKDEAIWILKLDMEENRFYYIPPRVNPKRFDYLHYVRKRDEGALTYVAHADYYILLRACAKVAKIEIRLMHIGVLSFERRLAWIEHRINHCLHLKPPTVFCEFCNYLGNASAESLGLSNLNI